MNFLKYQKTKIKRVLQFTHSLCGGDKLNSKEQQGYVNSVSKLKFLPHTAHNLPFKLALSVRGVSQKYQDNDPFSLAMKTSEQNFDGPHFCDVLRHQIAKERNQAIEDYNPFISGQHKNKPCWASVLPWDNICCNKMHEGYLQLATENRLENIPPTEHDKFGQHLIYSNEMIDSHKQQFEKLYNNIKTAGFIRGHSLPRVNILLNGDKWKWMMTGQGNHRFYILQAMSWTNFPCEIQKVIDINEHKKWPNVINGDYTSEEAIAMFERIFNGENPIRGII